MKLYLSNKYQMFAYGINLRYSIKLQFEVGEKYIELKT